MNENRNSICIVLLLVHSNMQCSRQLHNCVETCLLPLANYPAEQQTESAVVASYNFGCVHMSLHGDEVLHVTCPTNTGSASLNPCMYAVLPASCILATETFSSQTALYM